MDQSKDCKYAELQDSDLLKASENHQNGANMLWQAQNRQKLAQVPPCSAEQVPAGEPDV
jgi:hypothetical protein